MNNEIHKELDYIIKEFNNAKIVRLKEGSEFHICSYKIGKEDCITIFEDYGGDDWSGVNVYGKSLKELYKNP
jgi:hypothetical protein